MKTIDWYFDFISPFAYIASQRLDILPDDVELRLQPILFAGLLARWNTKGPAEIPPMRKYTFRHVVWLAHENNIPLKMPPEHPFNPLKLLRLSMALGNEKKLVQRLFSFVWAEGKSTNNPDHWQALLEELAVPDADLLITEPDIKKQLFENTSKAIDNNVFGVPTFIVNGELFFGQDSMEFMLSYLKNPQLFHSDNMKLADHMPDGLHRKI